MGLVWDKPENSLSAALGLSPNQKLSNPVPRIGLVCNSRSLAQSSVLPDSVEPLPRASDNGPEIPNASSAVARRTSAANMYVPIKFLFIERMPTNTTTSIPTQQTYGRCGTVRQSKKPPDTDQEPDDQPKLVSSLKCFRSVCQVCSKYQKKKKPRIRQSAPSPFLSCGDAGDHLHASPLVILRSQVRIVFDEENGNRDDHIGASLHQTLSALLRDPVP